MQLQVSDEAVASLVGMGFSLTESRRALRVSGQDMQRAVDFVVDDRHRKSQKLEDDRRRQQERRSVNPLLLYEYTSDGLFQG